MRGVVYFFSAFIPRLLYSPIPNVDSPKWDLKCGFYVRVIPDAETLSMRKYVGRGERGREGEDRGAEKCETGNR